MMAAQLFGSVVLWIIGLLVLHFVIYSAVKSGTVTVTLDSSKNYYIEFLGPCDFNGYIQ